MLNEQLLFKKYKTQETKKKNTEDDKRIYEDVVKHLNKNVDWAAIDILDKSPPNEGEKELFERIANSKSASAITITFKSIFRDNLDEEQLRKHLVYTLSTITFNKDIPLEICLIPDIDNSGNFHFHGVIISPLKHRVMLKRLITKYIGFMKFDYINDIQGWIDYCYKKPPKYTQVYSEEEIQYIYIMYNP